MRKHHSLSSLFLLALFSFCLQSCNDGVGKCNLTKSDSLKIFNSLKIQMGDTLKKAYFSTPGMAAAPLTEEMARKMHQEYLKSPLPIYWNDGTTDHYIRGFQLDKNEIDSIHKYGVRGARIYLGKTTSGEYKLILTAIDAAFGNRLSNSIFDDFFPCPTYCAETVGASEAARRSDLNWDGNIFRPVKP